MTTPAIDDLRKDGTPHGWQAITLPDIGSGDRIMRVSTWLTEIGEAVVAGDPIVEVSIKGLTFDVEARATGVLRRIECSGDDTVAVGNILGWIEPSESVA